ncbi:MAG: rhomboid family intramembrane serine protease [Deltaproteobacteria bacterium]|nr:rhomboid family intramembrane serine protease [Deltaproteobacteria bacterium]MBW1901425.1 rhomboid family intramembrane serine protease [Deltaproteobacteria bacterium]
MIPLKDENPSTTVPIINILLIITNVYIFVYQIYFASRDAQDLFLRLGFIPFEVSHFVDISPENLVPIPFTIFTAMFIHGGWLHLLSNMLYLWIFGDNVEDRLGHGKYLFFYVMCGMMASVVHGFMDINSKVPSVGASGAIAGVLAAYLYLFPGARIKTLFVVFVFAKIIKLPALIVLGLWILAQVLSGFSEYGSQTGGGIAWFAHIGGFVSGLVLIAVMRKRNRGRYSRKRAQ